MTNVTKRSLIGYESYVYMHIFKESKVPFYIGSGKNYRAWCTKKRSRLWKEVANEFDYEVIIVKKDLTRKEALDLEYKLQEMYKPKACLRIAGNVSRSTRNKMRDAHIGKTLKPSTIDKMKANRAGSGNLRAKSVINCRGEVFSTTKEAAEHFNLKSKCHISAVCKGTRKHSGKYEDGTPIKWRYYNESEETHETDISMP